MNHEQFQDMLDELVGKSGVGQEVLGEVLARMSLRAPEETSRMEIAAGNPTARRPVDQRAIPQGTVSKAVKALKEKGSSKTARNSCGALTAAPSTAPPGKPLRDRRSEGHSVRQQPRLVTTALVGLDSSRVLGTAHDAVDRWDQVAELIHQHVTSLKSACDQDRAAAGCNRCGCSA